MRVLAVLAVCCAALALATPAVAFSRVDIGDRIARNFGPYIGMPITSADAKAQGWVALTSTCAAGLGVPWAQQSGGPTSGKPITLYFTPYGQVAGAGVVYNENYGGTFPTSLIAAGYLQAIGPNKYYQSVSFRAPADACSSKQLRAPLGDRLVINAGLKGIAEELPLTVDEAKAAGWVPGACFAGMGTHWFKDLTVNNTLTYKSSNLLPVVLMFDMQGTRSNNINAFFFASPVVQQSLLPPSANQWEPIPLPNVLMCKNFCDAKCGFTDTQFYSTLHLYLRDRAPVTCNGGCTIGCCPGI